ncbi:MAG: hypothetical protein KatS3mg003_0777 [Candidatus Nitrosocaldaceae archaeon]|nr:MAG: hypothetical protein KatS3mg003_0777 [Candidatus Nitrosocaldaceae archaeon]
MNLCNICINRTSLNLYASNKCDICNNISINAYHIYNKLKKQIANIEFNTFLVGIILPEYIIEKDEAFTNKFISLKKYLNKEISKLLANDFNKIIDKHDPHITILIDLINNSYRLEIKSLYIYGGYKKLVRGIPQARWLCKCIDGCELCKGRGKLYRTSIQELIAKPILKYSRGKDSAIHAAGREDIDVRCLDYRPFIIEIKYPKRRSISLDLIEEEINRGKYVNVKGLHFSNKDEVRRLKSLSYDKTYRALVTFLSNIDEEALIKVKELINKPIVQKTPTRVKHRRADIIRIRRIKDIQYNIISKRRAEFIIRAEGGLYIKEFINGDNERTNPSIAYIINNKVRKIILDVIKLHIHDKF